eukprot:1677982-Pleurochrysis_carterae.AAC.1
MNEPERCQSLAPSRSHRAAIQQHGTALQTSAGRAQTAAVRIALYERGRSHAGRVERRVFC